MDVSFTARMLAAFATIAVVLYALQYVAKYGLRQRLSGPGGARRLLTVVETTMLPGGSSLHVVKTGDEYVVIGRSANYIARVGELPAPAVEAWLAGQAESPLGGARLAAMLGKLRRGGT